MSTFNGRIKEYPILSIDHFSSNNPSKYYILSHVHKDHTRGLENPEFKESVYCTEQTAILLPLLETRASSHLCYKHLQQCLIPVPYYEPIAISPHSNIKLTFLPANHCPGAALILIEGDNGTVLYTGDMRAEPNFVKTHLSCLSKHRIKNLYMDTTCCSVEKRNFISKKQSIDLLINLIKSYPETHHMYLDCWTAGYEEIWICVIENFGQKIHVSQQRYNMFCQMNSIFDDILTTDSNTRFHSCQWDQNCYMHQEYMVSIHPTPNKNTKPFPYSQSKQLLMTDLSWDCKPFQKMILPFSTHSSLLEIVYFYNFVNPCEFTPCVARGGWQTLENMRLLLIQEGCTVDKIPSLNTEYALSLHRDLKSSTLFTDEQSSAHNSINYLSSLESLSATTRYTPTFLSVPATQDDPFPILAPDTQSNLSESEPEPENELFITKENTCNLLKSIKRLKRKKRLGSKNRPICL